MNIIQQLKDNNTINDCVSRLTVKITISSNNKRELLFRGFFNTFRTHFVSINILLEKKLYSSAFALIRVMFDSMIRGLYMYHTYRDDEIESMDDNNWNFPKTTVMCNKLDEIFGDNLFDTIRSGTYGSMSDYTHTGSKQITQNFKEETSTIEAHFSDDLILDTLNGMHNLMKIFSLNYFEESGLKKDKISIEEITNFNNTF